MTDKHTHRHTHIATYRKHRPKGRCFERRKKSLSQKERKKEIKKVYFYTVMLIKQYDLDKIIPYDLKFTGTKDDEGGTGASFQHVLLLLFS